MPSDLSVENELLRDALRKLYETNEQGRRYARGHPAFVRARMILDRKPVNANQWLRAYDAFRELAVIVAWSGPLQRGQQEFQVQEENAQLARLTLDFVRYLRAGQLNLAEDMDKMRSRLAAELGLPGYMRAGVGQDRDGMVEQYPPLQAAHQEGE